MCPGWGRCPRAPWKDQGLISTLAGHPPCIPIWGATGVGIQVPDTWMALKGNHSLALLLHRGPQSWSRPDSHHLGLDRNAYSQVPPRPLTQKLGDGGWPSVFTSSPGDPDTRSSLRAFRRPTPSHCHSKPHRKKLTAESSGQGDG